MQKRLFSRVRAVYIWLMAPLLGLAVFMGVFATVAAPVATAATSSNLNFQARLLTNTGAVVPDGNYNIEFKIYTADGVTGTQGSCSGSCVWMETRTVAGGTSVQVINGYFSVNLGSVTAFGSTINWDQQLWLTMRIGGTASSPSWDGEMQNSGHSIALTALPYAFTAGKLTSGTGAGRGTLSFANLGQATDITLPDPGAVSATICYQGSSACNFINNSTGGPQTANFNIQSAAIGSIGAIINAASGQTADIFELKNSSIVFSVGNNGQTLFKPTASNDSTTFFQIQPAGSTTPVFDVDTANTRIGIGTNAPSFNLHVVKNDSTGTEGNYPEIRATNSNSSGNSIASVDAESAENGVIAKLLVDGGGGAGSTGSHVGGATGTKSNHPFFLYTNNTARAELDTSGNFGIGLTGALSATLQVAGTTLLQANSATAFRVQNSTGSETVMAVDTTGNQLALGTAGTSGINGKLVFNTTNASNTSISIAAASTAASYSLILPTTGPALGQCLQNDGTTLGQLTFGPCGATGTFLSKNAVDTSSADAGSGYLYTFTNSGSAGAGGVLSLDNGTNTGTILNIKGASSTAFQVLDNSSHKILTVDTSAGVLRLGQASTVDGGLVFQNSTNANGITLNTSGANSSYTLSLPAQAPSGGLCIQTSTGNASQLVFASCANNNTSISEVAQWDSNNSSTLPVSPGAVGDEIVLTTQIPSSGVTVTGISGGGVTNWSKVTTSAGNGTVNRVEMWVGTVSTVGSSTVTITYSASPGANEITATEFTAAGVNQSTSWGIESFSSQLNSTASTTVTYPSLTAVNGAELYYGYAQVQNAPATAGSTSGFNYIQTSTQHNMIAYNPSLTANTAYQPTANQNSSGQSNTVAAILTAFVTSTAINNSTSLQKANFYVQAANAGSVAGVLQAASSGSADILNLRNSGGTNVVTVSSTGDVAVKSTGSTTAFQVQNNSSYSVMAVDTTGNQVVLGDATHLSGKITFKDSSDSNTISIAAPTSVATSYNLLLPSNAPTAGLCLATSPSDATQLIFSSCATQVSAATISYVGKWDNNGTGVTSISTVSPTSVGDLMVFYSHTGSGGTINTISGGGVASGGWTKVTAYTGAGTPGNIEMWRGVVATAGASAINVTYTGTAGTNEIVAEEFTMGSANGTWAIDTSGTATTTSSVTTVNYPTLTPLNSNELYAGYAYGGGTMSAGSTTGFTYVATGASKYLTYKTNVTGGTPYTPTATQTSGVYASIAAIIEAYVGTSVIVNTTATQQANFNVQASVSGSVAGVLQAAASGSADIFQAKDSSGNNVMSVNATAGVGSFGLTLGTPTVSSGQIIFNASGNSNYITITAPSTPGTSYQLKLPSAAAAPGQCLAASPSDSTQLVFSSCANQVTSVAISFVNNWKASGNNITTLAISPANLNDIIVVFSSPRNGVSTTGISGCSITWSKVSGSTAGSGADTSAIDMYKGVVTTTGSCTLTATFSGSEGNPNELAAMEFTTGSTTGSWVVDASNTQYNSSSSTSMTFPSLTPQSSRDLYVGYGAGGTYSSGCYTGFTCVAGNLTNRVGLYDTSISAASQPVVTTTTSSASMTVGALIAAYSSSSVISNSTVTQQGNFNVQAATSGSVAGVLQAFGGGTGDIFDLLDGSGTLVGKVDYQGNLLVRPSTAGATAFQVQNTSNVNVLSVDTSALQVVIGAGSTGESTVSVLVLDNKTGSSADPASAVNGAMYYNAVTHTFRCAEAGAWQNCAGLLYSNTSKSTANSNCSNNCSAFSTVAPIPANYCQAGKIIRLSANGYFSSQATATNIQFGVYYGTDAATAANDVLLGTVSPAVSVTSASNNYFQLNLDINCFSTTSMQAGGVLSIQAGAAASGLTSLPMNATTAATVVTSSTKNIYIFPIWSAASASNTATLAQFGVNAP